MQSSLIDASDANGDAEDGGDADETNGDGDDDNDGHTQSLTTNHDPYAGLDGAFSSYLADEPKPLGNGHGPVREDTLL